MKKLAIMGTKEKTKDLSKQYQNLMKGASISSANNGPSANRPMKMLSKYDYTKYENHAISRIML